MHQSQTGVKPSTSPASGSLYKPALDGLRVLAFGLVLIHHLPKYEPSSVLMTVNRYGWVGVELFFVISAYLFFHLLRAEDLKNGGISVPRFFARRLLRIYPLMVLFPLATLAIYGTWDQLSVVRLLAIALFSDNIMMWLHGYNISIPFSPHLWTLSFEFQIYLLIPFAFLIYKAVGEKTFLLGLLGISIFCFTLRGVFTYAGLPHPIIWVTPIFRPDSVLLGLALAIVRPKWHWGLSLAVAAVAGAAFISQALPWETVTASLFQYPIAALMCVAIVDSVLRCPVLAAFFGWGTMRALGTISFGLYVFHLWAITTTNVILTWLSVTPSSSGPGLYYAALVAMTVALTVAAAAASYKLVETPFNKIKLRISAVDGRA